MTDQAVLQPQMYCKCHISPFVTIKFTKNVITTSNLVKVHVPYYMVTQTVLLKADQPVRGQPIPKDG